MARRITGHIDRLVTANTPVGSATDWVSLTIEPDVGRPQRVLVPAEDAAGLRYGDRVTVELVTEAGLPHGVEKKTMGQGRGGLGSGAEIVVRVVQD